MLRVPAIILVVLLATAAGCAPPNMPEDPRPVETFAPPRWIQGRWLFVETSVSWVFTFSADNIAYENSEGLTIDFRDYLVLEPAELATDDVYAFSYAPDPADPAARTVHRFERVSENELDYYASYARQQPEGPFPLERQ